MGNVNDKMQYSLKCQQHIAIVTNTNKQVHARMFVYTVVG